MPPVGASTTLQQIGAGRVPALRLAGPPRSQAVSRIVLTLAQMRRASVTGNGTRPRRLFAARHRSEHAEVFRPVIACPHTGHGRGDATTALPAPSSLGKRRSGRATVRKVIFFRPRPHPGSSAARDACPSRGANPTVRNVISFRYGAKVASYDPGRSVVA